MAKEDKPEKQEPEKPKQGSSGMKMPVIIGIIAGVVIIQAVIVIIIMKMFIAPSSAGETHGKAKDAQTESSNWKNSEAAIEEFLKSPEGVQFVETGRITTNPRNSDKFVVINLGIEYKLKGEEKPKESKEGALPPVLMSRVKGIISGTLGGYSVEELQANRDSLATILKSNMKKTFRENKIYLRDIILQEFIIQF